MILVIKILFNLFYYSLLIRVILSWFPVFKPNRFSDFIFQITEPILSPIRSLIPVNQSGIDFSPLILFIILNLLRSQLIALG